MLLSKTYILYISIHALREEGDAGGSAKPPPRDVFLSTPSARRATWGRGGGWFSTSNFYPRPPRGGRHPGLHRPGPGERISIHALREEGDVLPPDKPRLNRKFLSTPSARRATQRKGAGRDG